MKLGSEWLELDEVGSTQDVAGEQLRTGSSVSVIIAHHQSKGRGRLGREWISEKDDSVTMSLLFHDYADHPRPYLVGMAVAVAAAGAIHAVLRWPNDLNLGDRKAGGILTELMPDAQGRLIPVVGLGLNLNQKSFPEAIRDLATSVHLYHGGAYRPEAIAKNIVERLALLPEPTDWHTLEPIWKLFDHTPGKRYKLTSGEEAIALGIGSEAQLLCSVGGETRSVLAAEAMLGV
jgi:BirA family biotin operon repressor/biotin-[acetyl-CoA-carboxylase] ligase